MENDNTFTEYFRKSGGKPLKGKNSLTPLRQHSSIIQKVTNYALHQRKVQSSFFDKTTKSIHLSHRHILPNDGNLPIQQTVDVLPETSLNWHQPGASKTFSKLKHGIFHIEQEIDLHGYTLHEAMQKLEHTLHQWIKHGIRTVRIIHGKGSSHQPSVIKAQVYCFIPRHRYVIACTSCPPKLGGSGALLVRLKNNQRIGYSEE